MRITVIEPLGTGGLVHFAYQICAAMASRGVDVTLVTSRNYELSDWPHDFRLVQLLKLWPAVDQGSEGRPATRMRRLWKKGRRAVRGAILIREWVRLTWFLLATRPDLVQFSGISVPAPAVFLSLLRRRGVTVSQICHEYEERDEESRYAAVRRFLLGRSYRQIDHVFFLSNAVRDSLRRFVRIPVGRTSVIPHGNQDMFVRCARLDADLSGRYGIAPGEFVILLFGILRPSKGAIDLLHAFAALGANPRAKLLIVGHPTKYADMASFFETVRELRIQDHVIVDPRYVPMEEVGPLIALSAVVVLPYRSATQSGVLHLAYSFAKPVIATKAGGLEEDIIPGRTGLLVEPGRPDELAAALRACIADQDATWRMGQEARRLAETKHAWTNIAAMLLAVYETIVPGVELPDGDRCRPAQCK
jgi:glycosyltransferase involved in cell wall biosynthesis